MQYTTAFASIFRFCSTGIEDLQPLDTFSGLKNAFGASAAPVHLAGFEGVKGKGRD